MSTYNLWHTYPRNFPKDLRYTLGTKIDLLFIEILEPVFLASTASGEQKLPYLYKASVQLDLLKFFLQVAWESKALDSKKYIHLSELLGEIGKMLGGWQKHILALPKENPA